MALDVVLKHFESPDEVREMEKGTFEIRSDRHAPATQV